MGLLASGEDSSCAVRITPADLNGDHVPITTFGSGSLGRVLRGLASHTDVHKLTVRSNDKNQ